MYLYLLVYFVKYINVNTENEFIKIYTSKFQESVQIYTLW